MIRRVLFALIVFVAVLVGLLAKLSVELERARSDISILTAKHEALGRIADHCDGQLLQAWAWQGRVKADCAAAKKGGNP